MHPTMMIALALCNAGQTPLDPLISSRIERRVVKSFDFDEARVGNFESTPMNWARHVAKGFPRYLEGRFDRTLGHAAPPSLRLSVMGGSIGVVYEGRDIPVHPRSDYRVAAWVRPDRLRHARAYITAYFLDRAMQRIESSECRSAPIGGDGDAEWREVVLDLPGGTEDARWIGLGCWVLQPGEAGDSPRPIKLEDMSGGAWFDDIMVLRLPRISIEAGSSNAICSSAGITNTPRAPAEGSPSGVFAADEPFEIATRVFDPDGVGIRAALAVEDSDGAPRLAQAIPIATAQAAATRVDLSRLGPGWYRARLGVYTEDRLLIEREAALVRLAPDLPGADRRRGVIGTSLVDWSRQPWGDVHRLLREAGVSSVKIPFWSAGVSARDLISGNPDMDRALHDLQSDGTRVLALLGEPPDVLAIQYDPAKRSLVDILSSPATRWRPYLALLIARYGATVAAWQIGRDGDDGLLGDPRTAGIVAQVRQEVESLAQGGAMVVPVGLLRPSRLDAAPGTYVSLNIPAFVRPESLPEQLAPFLSAGRRDVWATIESADDPRREHNLLPKQQSRAPRYDTRVRLADLARRIVLTRVAGASTVFVEQPWSLEMSEGGSRLEPRPEFLVVRTLAQALSGTGPAQALPTDPSVHASLFPRTDGSGTVVAWRDSDDGEPAALRLAVGSGARGYDVLGRRVDPREEPGTPAGAGMARPDRTFSVWFSPLVLAGVDAGRIRLQASMRLTPAQLQPGGGQQTTAIVLENTLDHALRGRLLLRAPDGWRLDRTAIDISLAPGRTVEYPLAIRLPTNVATGASAIHATLRIEDTKAETIEADVPVRIGADELYINAWVEISGDRLIVHHRVTNRGRGPLDLRCFVVAPGRPRVSQFVRGLAPGATAQRRYELDRAGELVGQRVRVGVEQPGGTLRHNLLLPVG